MNLINILRFINGFVEFSCEGGFTERFINLCVMNRIKLWDISYSGKSLSAKIKASDFHKLKKISRLSGVILRIKKKSGIIFTFRKHSYRTGIILSVFLYLIFVFSANQFVWIVEPSGNVKIPEQDLISEIKKYGLDVGTFIPFFDETKAANLLAKNSDKAIDWAAINIKGSKAVIEIRENNASIKDTAEKTPSNIVAAFDGLLISVEAESGIPVVKNGYAVKKGDLLISGVFENDDMSSSFIESKGKITALHTKRNRISFNKKAEVKRISDYKLYFTLNFLSIDIPLNILTSDKKYIEHYSDELYLSYNNIKLPLCLKTKTFIKKSDTTRYPAEVFLSSCEKYSEINYKLNANTNLISEITKITDEDNAYIFNSEFNCIDFINVEQKINFAE